VAQRTRGGTPLLKAALASLDGQTPYERLLAKTVASASPMS
jgi:hypothetical protein